MNLNKKMGEKEKKAIISDLEKKYNDARQAQRGLRRKWDKLEAYVDGKQVFDKASGKLRGHEFAQASSETNSVDDEGLVINDVRRVNLSNMQRLTAYSIQPKVIPTNRNNDNKVAARLGTIYLADLIRRTDEEAVKKKIARSLGVYGSFFLKPSFDPSLGDLMDKPTLNIFDKAKAWVVGREQAPEGDIALDVLTPRNVLLPRYCQELSKADEVTEVHIVTCDYVYRRHGLTVPAETVAPDESRMLGDPEVAETDRGDDGETGVIERVILKEKFCRPSPRYPRGAIFTWANGVLLRSTELLKWYPDIPYFSGEMIYNDRSPYGDSILWDLLPHQDMINKSGSAMLRYIEIMGQLKRWMPRGANISEKALTNGTGLNVEYDGAKPPEFEHFPEMNRSIVEINGLFRDYMASHGYANELAKVKKAISGNAIGALQEIDDTVMRPAIKSIQTALTKAFHFVLQITPKYITEDRQVKQGGMQSWQVEVFNGSMLKGNFHCEINLMTGIPTNKILRLEFLKGLYKDGLMKDYEVRSHMEFGMDEEAMEEAQKENEVAQNIVQRIENFPDEYVEVVDTRTGKRLYVSNVVPMEFENHQLIYDKLTLAMRENYSHWNQWVKAAAMRQWRFRKSAIAQEAQAQAMLAAGPQAPGAPASPPAGGAPAGTFPGPAEPWSLSSRDSFQSADQQPPQEMVPAAMSTGFQNN